jgi:hypothetical protein
MSDKPWDQRTLAHQKNKRIHDYLRDNGWLYEGYVWRGVPGIYSLVRGGVIILGVSQRTAHALQRALEALQAGRAA